MQKLGPLATCANGKRLYNMCSQAVSSPSAHSSTRHVALIVSCRCRPPIVSLALPNSRQRGTGQGYRTRIWTRIWTRLWTRTGQGYAGDRHQVLPKGQYVCQSPTPMKYIMKTRNIRNNIRISRGLISYEHSRSRWPWPSLAWHQPGFNTGIDLCSCAVLVDVWLLRHCHRCAKCRHMLLL